MLKILGFPNGSQAVLKRRINMIRVVTLLDLQNKQKWLDGDSSIIIVESGHEPRTVWRRSKIKNWHSGPYRHSTLLTRTHQQAKPCFGVIFKTGRIHSERILKVSFDNLHTERNELALLSGNLFPSLIISCCYDHDILQWHTKHFRGPSKPNKKISGLIYGVTWLC